MPLPKCDMSTDVFCVYRILELTWPFIAPDSLSSCPYVFYEWEMGAVNVHLVSEARKLEPLYSNTVLTGQRPSSAVRIPRFICTPYGM